MLITYYNTAGSAIISHAFETEGKIRANRANLRTWLSQGLNISWGKRYSTHHITENGGVRVVFEDGSIAEGGTLVGADGVQSRGMSLSVCCALE